MAPKPGPTRRGPTLTMPATTLDDDDLMTLPRELFSRLDRRAVAFVAGSVLIHASIAVAAWVHDRAQPRTRALPHTAVLEPAMVDLLTALPFDPTSPMTPDDATPSPSPAPPPAPGAAIPTPAPGPATPRHGGGHRPSLPEMSAEDYIKALHGGGGPSDVPGLATLPGIGDDDPRIGGDPDRGPRVRDPIGPRPPGDGPPGDVPGFADPDKDPHTPTPTPRDPGPAPEPTIDGDWIAKVVHAIETRYMSGLERCQKKLMATDPLATSLTVKLAFTVEDDGSVSAHSAKSDSAMVSACIGGLMGAWDLPAPPSGKDSHVSVKLALQGS